MKPDLAYGVISAEAAEQRRLAVFGREAVVLGGFVTYPGNSDPATIGAFAGVAQEALIYLGHGIHDTNAITAHCLAENGPPWIGGPALSPSISTTIGNDAWVGRGASVLPGVTVGDGAIVGAHAVVAKDVPPYAVVVGNPATVVRRRFSDREVETLLCLRWWEWPDTAIKDARALLLANDVAAIESFAQRERLNR